MNAKRAASTYDRLSLNDFASLLLSTGDLDPVYITIFDAGRPTEVLHRFVLGYSFFYHVGVASKLSEIEGPRFFSTVIELANDKKTPRASERRHFRGKACLKSLNYFSRTYENPDQAMGHLMAECRGKDVIDVLQFVKRWPLYGPWIGFKLADLMERVLGVPITFRRETLKLYKEPTKGAALWCEAESLNYHELGISGVVQLLEKQFGEYKAPPAYDRPVGVQECETVLCKWKSHLNGHYRMGKDSREILEHLHGWGSLAESLRKYVPQGEL